MRRNIHRICHQIRRRSFATSQKEFIKCLRDHDWDKVRSFEQLHRENKPLFELSHNKHSNKRIISPVRKHIYLYDVERLADHNLNFVEFHCDHDDEIPADWTRSLVPADVFLEEHRQEWVPSWEKFMANGDMSEDFLKFMDEQIETACYIDTEFVPAKFKQLNHNEKISRLIQVGACCGRSQESIFVKDDKSLEIVQSLNPMVRNVIGEDHLTMQKKYGLTPEKACALLAPLLVDSSAIVHYGSIADRELVMALFDLAEDQGWLTSGQVANIRSKTWIDFFKVVNVILPSNRVCSRKLADYLAFVFPNSVETDLVTRPHDGLSDAIQLRCLAKKICQEIRRVG